MATQGDVGYISWGASTSPHASERIEQGAFSTRFELPPPRINSGTLTVYESIATSELARSLSDGQIAGLLNRLGKRTGKGNSWTKDRVRTFRNGGGIAVYREGERRERGELVLLEAGQRLEVDPSVIRRLIRAGILPARQACKGAPWLIAEQALNTPRIRQALSSRNPLPPEPNQQDLDFA